MIEQDGEMREKKEKEKRKKRDVEMREMLRVTWQWGRVPVAD